VSVFVIKQLNQEKKRREQKLLGDDETAAAVEVKPKVEPGLPGTPTTSGAAAKSEARRKVKSHEKRDQLDKARRRSSMEKITGGAAPVTPPWKTGPKAVAERKPPDIAARGGADVAAQPSSSVQPPRLPPPPTLPTAPIPVSELPPAAVRSPPAKVVNTTGSPLIPALSNLTPIPLRELQLQQVNRTGTLGPAQSLQEAAVSTAANGQQQPPMAGMEAARPAAAATEFISIQVLFFY
jgi:hypothetical protein